MTDGAIKAATAADAPLRAKTSNYPDPFAACVEGRAKRPLGDLFGLKNFGVNHTTLAPGAASALLHRHARQDEMVYVLSGAPVLVTEDEEIQLAPGMVCGFPAGGWAHQIVNRTDEDAVLLEIGDRTPGDSAEYPRDDLAVKDVDGQWVFTHKDGAPY